MEKCSIGSYKDVRKKNRKQSKCVTMLLRDTGIKCSETPTKNLFVGNAGLLNGLQREDLLRAFSLYGLVEDVIMLPGKSYSFIIYQQVSDAVIAFNAVHGKPKNDLNMGCLYLAFAEKCPDEELYKVDYNFPLGLELFEDFVTSEEERELLQCIPWSEDDMDGGQSLKHRSVQHYGFKFRYDINNVDKEQPLSRRIPNEFDFMIPRLKEKGCKMEIPIPDQLTVNKYVPGQGIPPHIDTHSAFEEHILSLSLGSSIVMEFENSAGNNASVLLPQRSLLIMSGEARYAWKHGITPRKMDVVRCKDGGLTVMKRGIRTSFTFRKVLQGECACTYHDCCDSFQKKNTLQQEEPDEVASRLEELHVHQVYEQIANHFNKTRHKPWPNVASFLESFPCGSILVDIGCGNGKYFGNTGLFEVGCDQSMSLAKVCQEKGFQIFTCNCLKLPLRSGVADGCISIAVIHHLSTKARRLRAVEEMARVLRPGGQALIYVWAKNQKCGNVKSNYLKFTEKKRENNISIETGCIKSEPKLENTNFYHVANKQSTESEETSSNEAQNNSKTVLQENFELNHTTDNDIQIKNFNLTDSHTKAKCLLPELPIHTNRTQFKHSDVFVPWKLKESGKENQPDTPVFYRYYHVFEEGELEQMCACVKAINIVRSYYDEGNWCIIFEKL